MSVERDRHGNGRIARWREHGRQRSRKFALNGDAEVFERDVKRRQQLGPLAVQQLTARGGPTLDQWIEQRWVPEHAAALALSTRERYANVYEGTSPRRSATSRSASSPSRTCATGKRRS